MRFRHPSRAPGGFRHVGARARRLCLAGMALVVPAPCVAAGTPSLFDSHELLRLTLAAPLATLLAETGGSSPVGEQTGHAEVAATLGLEDGRRVPVKLTTYGKSRQRECDLPPLKMSVEPAAAVDTPFEGEGTLRVVTHCRSIPDLERYMLLEYLIYRSYSLLAQPALRVRLARFRYQETEGRSRDREALGFFVEDIGLAAERAEKSWLDIESQRLADLDSAHTALVCLFQYMTGNTDWSAMRGPAGKRCCHNTAVVGDEQGGPRFLLPYDFDQSGLVNAPYAAPDRELGLRKVTQRRYRGFCAHNDELQAAIESFNARRTDLESLFGDPSLPHAPTRAVAWRYVTRFYDEINHPKKLNNRIIRWCRGPVR